MVRCRLRCHGDEMIQEQPPGLQAVAEAINLRLTNSVLGEQNEELENRKIRVKLNPLEMRRYEPVEKITTFGKIPIENTAYSYVIYV